MPDLQKPEKRKPLTRRQFAELIRGFTKAPLPR